MLQVWIFFRIHSEWIWRIVVMKQYFRAVLGLTCISHALFIICIATIRIFLPLFFHSILRWFRFCYYFFIIIWGSITIIHDRNILLVFDAETSSGRIFKLLTTLLRNHGQVLFRRSKLWVNFIGLGARNLRIAGSNDFSLLAAARVRKCNEQCTYVQLYLELIWLC